MSQSQQPECGDTDDPALGLTEDDFARARAWCESDYKHPAILVPDTFHSTPGHVVQMPEEKCMEARCLVVQGFRPNQISERIGRARSTIRRHVRGKRQCEHELPKLEFDHKLGLWEWAPEHDADYPACPACDADPLDVELAENDIDFACSECGHVWLPYGGDV